MCIAIPSRVVAIGEATATVERFGEQLVVSTWLLPEPPELGDYVVVRARSHAPASPGAADRDAARAPSAREPAHGQLAAGGLRRVLGRLRAQPGEQLA